MYLCNYPITQFPPSSTVTVILVSISTGPIELAFPPNPLSELAGTVVSLMILALLNLIIPYLSMYCGAPPTAERPSTSNVALGMVEPIPTLAVDPAPTKNEEAPAPTWKVALPVPFPMKSPSSTPTPNPACV